MNIEQAHSETKRLFAAFGTSKPPEVISEFARVLMDARCDTCALEAVAEMRDSGAKAPASIAALRGSITERTGSPAHFPHLSESTRESQAGKAEGWWRGEGVRTVQAALHCDKLHAEHITARIWFLGICAMDADALRVEAVADVWRWNATWNVTPALVAHNWEMGRRNAVLSVSLPAVAGGYPDSTWAEWMTKETKLLAGVIP